MKAITTKYHGAGNVRPARYSATDNDGNRITVTEAQSGNAPSADYNGHDHAAISLCNKMHWSGKLFRGWLAKGQQVYVWADPDAVIEVEVSWPTNR